MEKCISFDWYEFIDLTSPGGLTKFMKEPIHALVDKWGKSIKYFKIFKLQGFKYGGGDMFLSYNNTSYFNIGWDKLS